MSPSGLDSRRRLFPRIGFEGREPVAVDVPDTPIERFPLGGGIASARGKSSLSISESSRGWMILRCCAGRTFPLDLDAKVLESGISSESPLVPFNSVRYREIHPSSRRLRLIQCHFVAERILAVLCLGPFRIFLIHWAQHPRSAKNGIFSRTKTKKMLLTVNA